MVSTVFVQAQNESQGRTFAEQLVIGGSFTYLRFAEEDDLERYHEMVTHVNLATNVYKNVYVGISYMDIRTRFSNIFTPEAVKDNYYMAGAFAQYDFLGNQKNKLIGELSYHYGNYCTCGKGNPYESDRLSYFGFGGAYEWHLYKGLYLDTGFNVYTIINKRERKDIFTQYILGINYQLDL